jgi:hypothetical protein
LFIIKLISYSGITALIAVLALSCGEDYERLNGKWSASGDLGDTNDLHSWYIEYEFSGRDYVKNGYPPLREEGRIDIVEERGDSLKFFFNVIKSDPEQKSYEEWIVFKDSIIQLGGLVLHKGRVTPQ